MLIFWEAKTKILTPIKLQFFDNFFKYKPNACNKPIYIIYVLEVHSILYTTVVVSSKKMHPPWTYAQSAQTWSKWSPCGVPELTV